MKRRNFFRSLALLAGAASVSPNIFIPKFEPVRWKRTIVTPYDYEALQSFYGTWSFVIYRFDKDGNWQPENQNYLNYVAAQG